MTGQRQAFRWTMILALCLNLFCRAAEPAAGDPAGIVVEEVRRGSAADKAGLQKGDVLLSWAREGTGGNGPDDGNLLSPFDWTSVLIEQVPRGNVSLAGRRGETARTWVLPGGSPSGGDQTDEEVTARPVLTGEILALYSSGGEHLARGELEAGIELWRVAAARARAQRDTDLSLWLSVRQARTFAHADRWLEADSIYEELIEPLEASPLGDPRATQLLREWGRLWLRRRIWDRAEDCYRRALAIVRKLDPESLGVAWSLTDLGDLATRSGGAQDPDELFFQALDIRQRLAPGSSEVASSWRNLGSEALTDGDLRSAEESFRKALTLQQRATPGQIYVAERLLAVAAAKYFQKDFSASEKLYRQALTIIEREAPEDLGILGILQGIGAAAAGRGDWHRAEEALLRAVDLGERLAPASMDQMRFLLSDLGQAQRQLGKKESSTRHLCRSLQLAEERRKKFASNQELQLSWSFRSSEQYGDCARGLFEAGKAREAFDVLERGRARSFLHLLSERDLRFSELPPPRSEEWKQLTAGYDATQTKLAQAQAQKADQRRIWSLEGRLREIRRRKERILAESLPLSSLRHLDPLDLEEARQALDPGTALLFYAVGQEQTLLFVIKPADRQIASGFAVFPLPLKGEDLAARIDVFRDTLIEDRFDSRAAKEQGQRLYADLLLPAEDFLAGSERLLIIPDGSLHTLPFAALVRQDRYLIEWKPLHFAVSATAYAELRKRRRPQENPGSRKIVAFGEPLSAQPASLIRAADPTLQRSAQSALPDLPASRAEVEEISRLFPQTTVFLRGEATEENAKSLTGDVRWLHFAVHGLLNERVPLNSALVLSASPNGQEGGNGLLQAWEIMEELRLEADLVTLSACDTALGTEIGGEGLIGLTRAFQYAGARSVLATLWGITDKSTVPWMSRFYRELRDGQSKDEALRAAQIEQIRSSDGPYPFFWAAFQLYGDWQ